MLRESNFSLESHFVNIFLTNATSLGCSPKVRKSLKTKFWTHNELTIFLKFARANFRAAKLVYC